LVVSITGAAAGAADRPIDRGRRSAAGQRRLLRLERGADLLESGGALQVGRRALDLHRPPGDRVLREIGLPERCRVALLDLVADLGQRRHVGRRGQLAHLL